MFLKKPDLTAGSRPTLAQDEVLLFVQDGVGLYEGYAGPQDIPLNFPGLRLLRKYKIDSCQKGHAYLTSHRACYVDDADPRANSWALDLKDVDRHESQVSCSFHMCKRVTYRVERRLGFSDHLQKSPCFPSP